MAFGSSVMVASPGCTQLMSSVTSRFCDESARRSEVRPRKRTLTVSVACLVMTSSRGMRASETGTAYARSDTASRRGAETTNHTARARNSESALSQRLFMQLRVASCELRVASSGLRVARLATRNAQLFQSLLDDRAQRIRIEILFQHPLAGHGNRSVL